MCIRDRIYSGRGFKKGGLGCYTCQCELPSFLWSTGGGIDTDRKSTFKLHYKTILKSYLHFMPLVNLAHYVVAIGPAAGRLSGRPISGEA